MARVFISYSHDSDQHKQAVRDLAAHLRSLEGIEIVIDQDMLPGGPDEGWPYWSEDQVRKADKVLVVCTANYCKRYLGREDRGVGLGAVAEARLIHQELYNTSGVNHKYRVVLFRDSDHAFVPDTLQPYHRFSLYQPQERDALDAWVLGARLAAVRQPLAPPAIQQSEKPVPNNIPLLQTATIGRDGDIKKIEDLLRNSQLVTVTGVGGCGKSRVAMEAAGAAKANYPGGVWFVPLADLPKRADKERLLPSRVGRVVGAPEHAKRPPLESLAEHFANNEFLLVLDNCEHLIESCRELASYLLERCRTLTILTTSRRALGRSAGAKTAVLSQERLYPLAPLPTPSEDTTSIDEIQANPSVVLFVQRAEQRSPGWTLTAQNYTAVASLCRVLAGLPLAIEVTAARLAVKSVQEIEGGSRDLLKTVEEVRAGDLRAWKTLTAALEWSYGLLRPNEQRFMRSLAVFDGGWTEHAAEAVYARLANDPTSVLNHLQQLFENSLIVGSEAAGAKRFRFLEPRAPYGAEAIDR